MNVLYSDYMRNKILIVEDDKMQRDMLATLLDRKLEYPSIEARHGREALDMLEQDTDKKIRLVILDVSMPVMGGMEALGFIAQQYPHLPVIMLTGNKDVNLGVQAMKLGATDFITKPYTADRMVVTIRNALKISTLSREVTRLKSERNGTFTFEDMIGYADGLSGIVQIGRKAANSEIPVLITGETGTGKEVLAKAVHGESSRTGKPFIAVNCGAIPSQLVESTLFGHEKGSFTGATEKVIGKFREADGGTIFLDEVGELPLETQVKLLRVLQQKEVEPVGAGKPVKINVRIISATNRNLEEEVEKGRFREDLYFRLNVLQIRLPPLRERRQDIPALIDHFIERYTADHGGEYKSISPELERRLSTHEWPGNVRQLENTINRAMVMCEGPVLDVADLSSLFKGGGNMPETATAPSIEVVSGGLAISLQDIKGDFKTMDVIEQEAMQLALVHFEQNITQAAKALGMAKSTFYRKLQER
jgi:DNA-binding NtrC family response regulator